MKYKVVVDESEGKEHITDYLFDRCHAEEFECDTMNDLLHNASFFYLNFKSPNLEEIYVIIKKVNNGSYFRAKLVKKTVFSGIYLGQVV